MASAKQYQFFFQLTAALGPNFSKTFKTANDTMNALGNNIKDVQGKLKDVSAYQKQQTAVEKSKQKVSDLEKEHERLQAEYEESGGQSEKLKKKLDANTEALAKAKDKAADETEKLEQMGQALQEAGINTDNLSKSTEELQKDYEKLQKTQEKVTAINEKIEQNNEAISKTKSQLTGTIGAIAAVGTAIYAGPVKKAAEFQEQMSGVQAISGATAEELQELSQKAKEMGATTAFTATEAGEAFEYMAMAGWKTEDMLGGIEGIMNLASASGEDLASVSDIVTDALTAFGLSASDAGHFSDVLAQASSNANTNVSMMGSTFQKVAPVAGALGYSVEDVSLGIGLMANASIKAETAGTSLKTALANMAKPTTAQATAMEKYGISLTNTDGSMKSFGEVVENLRSSLGGLSETEQVAAATTIFGKESFAGMLAIVNASTEDYNKLTQAVYNCDGAAKQMAETKLDNLNGSITLAKSAFDALQVELGELLLPTLTEGVKTFTKITEKVTAFVRENPEAVKTIGKVAVALAGLKVGGLVAKLGFQEVYGGVLQVQKAFTLLKGLGLSNYLGSLTGGFLNFKNIGSGILGYFKSVKNAAGGVSTALGGVLSNSTLFTKIGGFFSGIGGKIGTVVTGAGSKVLSLFLSPFTKIGGKLGSIFSGVGSIIANSPLGKIGSLIGKGFGKITSFIAPVGNAIKTMLGPLGNLASSVFGPLGGVIGKVLPIVGVITAIITAVQLVKNHLQEIRAFIEKTFGSEALAVFDKVVAVITNIGDTIKNVFSEGNIGQAREKIQEIFGDKGVQVFDTLVNILGKVKTAVSNVIAFINANVVPVAEQILQVIINDIVPGIVNFIQAAAPTVMAIIQSIVDFVAAVIPIIADFIAGLMPVISEIITFLQTYVLPVISEVFTFITSTVLPAISSAVQAILPVVTQVLATLLPAIQTALTTIWNIVAPIIQGILQVVQAVMPVILSVVQSVIGSVQGIIQNLMTVLSGIIDFVTGVFTGNWSQAWEGIKSIFSGAVGGLGEIIKAPLNAVVSAVNTVIRGLNKMSVPDWVPGIGGKGINIPEIPGFANGTNSTPSTFIAGENGPELITNAANRKVFTAAQTGQIINNLSAAPTADNVKAGMSGAGTITIQVTNSPSITVNGGEDTGNIKQQLEQYDEEFLEKLRQIIVTVLKEQKDEEARVVYA
jgi:TP901 family phage tail tape measure protein